MDINSGVTLTRGRGGCTGGDPHDLEGFPLLVAIDGTVWTEDRKMLVTLLPDLDSPPDIIARRYGTTVEHVQQAIEYAKCQRGI